MIPDMYEITLLTPGRKRSLIIWVLVLLFIDIYWNSCISIETPEQVREDGYLLGWWTYDVYLYPVFYLTK